MEAKGRIDQSAPRGAGTGGAGRPQTSSRTCASRSNGSSGGLPSSRRRPKDSPLRADRGEAETKKAPTAKKRPTVKKTAEESAVVASRPCRRCALERVLGGTRAGARAARPRSSPASSPAARRRARSVAPSARRREPSVRAAPPPSGAEVGPAVDLGERLHEVELRDVADQEDVEDAVVRLGLRGHVHSAPELLAVGDDHVEHAALACASSTSTEPSGLCQRRRRRAWPRGRTPCRRAPSRSSSRRMATAPLIPAPRC